VRAAAVSHAFAGVGTDGNPAIMYTTGNDDCHLILRGGSGHPNFARPSVEAALHLLQGAELPERLVIDASHDNSGKDPARQPLVVGDVGAQLAQGTRAIVGVMLESFLVGGSQPLEPGRPLVYGQSITDACMDWETTVDVLDELAGAVRARRRAAS
jgi:3-deoxy-7-phosphoheptulonate synthase